MAGNGITHLAQMSVEALEAAAAGSGFEGEYVLEMERIGKRFAQVFVLKDVSVRIRRGSIHAIVGHNGAGKSTLMKIALGAERPTEGTVRVAGRQLTYGRPAEARTLGLGMVMQERSLIPTLSGLDNLFLNSETVRPLGLVNVASERAEAAGLLRELGLSPALLATKASEMSTIEQELMEIARALRLGNRVLVLDEPTAPLGRAEIVRLFKVLQKIAARGTGIVLITHHLAEVFAVSDEVTCLREGKVVLSSRTKDTNINDLIAAMLGRRLFEGVHVPSHSAGGQKTRASEVEPSLRVRKLVVGRKLTDVSFDAFAGEVLGVVGLAGSGRTTLLRTLFGDIRPADGEIRINGHGYRPGSPADAMANGVFLIPEDRAVRGLMLSKSIAENLSLVLLDRLSTAWGFLRFSGARRAALQMTRRLDIRARGIDQAVRELSGGNQQKVVLAKALTLGARILLLDEPTFGVDIGAAHEIIANVRAIADKGATVLWTSSDLLEVTRVADRIIVLCDGTIGTEIGAGDEALFTEDALVRLMQRRQFQPAEASHAVN
jgi:ribose transport system ATP-binding protein